MRIKKTDTINNEADLRHFIDAVKKEGLVESWGAPCISEKDSSYGYDDVMYWHFAKTVEDFYHAAVFAPRNASWIVLRVRAALGIGDSDV